MERPPPYVARVVAQRLGVAFWAAFRDAVEKALSGQDVRITSWYRSPGHNREVGGAAGSQHLIGTALDLVGPDAARAGEALRAEGFYVIDEGDHIHAQAFDASVARPLIALLLRVSNAS